MALLQSLALACAAGLLLHFGCGRAESPTSEKQAPPEGQESRPGSLPVATAAPQTAQPESAPAPGTVQVRPLKDDELPLPSPLGENEWNAEGCEVTVPHSGNLTVTARLAKGHSFGETSWIRSPGRIQIALGLAEITGEELLKVMNPMLTTDEQRAFLEAVPDFEQRSSYRMSLVVDTDTSDDSGASQLRSTSSSMLTGVPDGASLSRDGRSFAKDSPLILEQGEEAAIAVWVFGPGVSSDGPTTVSHAFDLSQRRYEITIDEERFSLDNYPYPFVELVIRWEEADEPKSPVAGADDGG